MNNYYSYFDLIVGKISISSCLLYEWSASPRNTPHSQLKHRIEVCLLCKTESHYLLATLKVHRFTRFTLWVRTQICVINSCIYPQTLSPTSAAANTTASEFISKYWSGKVAVTKLGKSDGKPMPVLPDLPPDELLKIIRCNCHTDCSSMRCTCRKHLVKCSPACGNSGCTNSNS